MTERDAKHDIFVSYAREDRERVRPIVTRLRAHGWRVWWDERLLPGDSFHDEIVAAIKSSRGILVVWSELSVKKKWVREEATAGEGLKAFVTIRIDDCAPPMGFTSYQAHLVSGGEGLDPTALAAVVRSFERTLGRPTRPVRQASTSKTTRATSERPGQATVEASSEVVRSFDPRARRMLAAGAAGVVVAAVAFVAYRTNRSDSDVSAGFDARQGRMATPGAIEEAVAPVTGARYPRGWDVLDATPAFGDWATEVRDPESGVVFRLIPAGSFQMGSPEDEPGREDDETLHDVTLTRPFYMAVTEFTFGQHARLFDGDVPEGRESCPVECNWDAAEQICRSKGWSLPTEAQWEFAARNGGPGRTFWWGDDPNDGAGKANLFDESGSRVDGHTKEFDFNDGNPVVAPVGEYESNGAGLYDMTGNVWEWCVDGYTGDYGSTPTTDPETEWYDDVRVLRGGSWRAVSRQCRLAFRMSWPRDKPLEGSGFRPVLNLP